MHTNTLTHTYTLYTALGPVSASAYGVCVLRNTFCGWDFFVWSVFSFSLRYPQLIITMN